MKFLPKFIKEQFSKEANTKPRLTTEQTWDMIHWSFLYSRGQNKIQELIFELITRDYQLPKYFFFTPVPQKAITKASEFRSTPRHLKTDAEEKRLLNSQLARAAGVEDRHKNIDSDTRLELNEISKLLILASEHKGNFSESTNDEIKQKLSIALLARDHNWVVSRNSKISHIQKYFLSNGKVLGGHLYEKLFDSIRDNIYTLISQPFEIPDSELTTLQMWNEIQNKLSKYEK